MQFYAVTNPVHTHTTIDKTLRAKVAATARKMGVSQAAVFNTMIATGFKVTHADTGTATRTTKAKRTKARKK